jgi:hypothetical protein
LVHANVCVGPTKRCRAGRECVRRRLHVGGMYFNASH